MICSNTLTEYGRRVTIGTVTKKTQHFNPEDSRILHESIEFWHFYLKISQISHILPGSIQLIPNSISKLLLTHLLILANKCTLTYQR